MVSGDFLKSVLGNVLGNIAKAGKEAVNNVTEGKGFDGMMSEMSGAVANAADNLNGMVANATDKVFDTAAEGAQAAKSGMSQIQGAVVNATEDAASFANGMVANASDNLKDKVDVISDQATDMVVSFRAEAEVMEVAHTAENSVKADLVAIDSLANQVRSRCNATPVDLLPV